MSDGLPLGRLVPDYVRRFTAYIPSKPDDELKRLYRLDRLIRLNNNENPLGPPEAARRVLLETPPERAAIYPSGDSFHLRRRIAERIDIDPEQILVGNGANEVIGFVIKAFCQPGDSIVTADRTFAVYEWVAAFSGIEARLVPLKDWSFDDEAMLAAIDHTTKILFICNPNNPTGTYWSRERLIRFLDRIGGEQIVVLDEAYAEFVEAPDFPDGIRLIDKYPNLIVFRTFSKMYGLAALRVGYMVGSPDAIDIVRRTCVVYSVNALAQDAAIAALGDAGHVARTNALIRDSRAYIVAAMAGLDLPVVTHTANFAMIRLPMSDTLAHRRLLAQGVMVRSMTSFRCPNYIRLSLAGQESMEIFVGALAKILGR